VGFSLLEQRFGKPPDEAVEYNHLSLRAAHGQGFPVVLNGLVGLINVLVNTVLQGPYNAYSTE
jgi:hypothetical protein